MEQEMVRDEIIGMLKGDYSTVRQMIIDCNCWDGSLEEYEYYENDEWFFRDYFSDAWQAVKYVCNGDYNSNDAYVQFDYDCLNSYSEEDVLNEIDNNIEEIFDTWYEKFEEGHVDYDYYSDEFKEMIDKYQEIIDNSDEEEENE